MTPTRQIYKKPIALRASTSKVKKYGIQFYETLQSAKADIAKLREAAAQCDQLNIVVRAEPTVDDPELLQIGKVFSGAAWTLIHERRRQDGWYDEPHEYY
jgi:hypothetical protein